MVTTTGDEAVEVQAELGGMESEEANPLIAEIDALNRAGDDDGAAGEEAAPEAPPETQEPSAGEEVGDTAEPAPESTPEPEPVVAPQARSNDVLAQRYAAMQQQLAQYESERARAQHAQEMTQYRTQLEESGVPSETAYTMAQNQMAARDREVQVTRQAQEYGKYIEGKHNAAMHYGEKYGISPKTLLQYDTPEAMESAALNQKKISDLEAKVKSLQQSKVPSQDMSGSTPTPGASNSDLTDLDRYNNGARDERANKAAARAAGF